MPESIISRWDLSFDDLSSYGVVLTPIFFVYSLSLRQKRIAELCSGVLVHNVHYVMTLGMALGRDNNACRRSGNGSVSQR